MEVRRFEIRMDAEMSSIRGVRTIKYISNATENPDSAFLFRICQNPKQANVLLNENDAFHQSARNCYDPKWLIN